MRGRMPDTCGRASPYGSRKDSEFTQRWIKSASTCSWVSIFSVRRQQAQQRQADEENNKLIAKLLEKLDIKRTDDELRKHP